MSERIEALMKQTVCGREFTIYGTAEEPLFLAKDVAKWIEHENATMMLKSIDDDEKVLNNVYTLGGEQESWFLTEDGLYEVLMLSRKPIAKAFKKEVKRILHDLRVNGTVVSPRVAMASQDEQVTSFQKALDTAVMHTIKMAEAHFLPQLARVESERDQAIKERAWINDKKVATAMANNSHYARQAKVAVKRYDDAKRENESLEHEVKYLRDLADDLYGRLHRRGRKPYEDTHTDHIWE